MEICVVVLQFQVHPVSCSDTKGILLCAGVGNLISLCSVCMPYLATLPHCSAMNGHAMLSVSTLPSVSDRIIKKKKKKPGCFSVTLLYQLPLSVVHSGLFFSLECTVIEMWDSDMPAECGTAHACQLSRDKAAGLSGFMYVYQGGFCCGTA